jgi:hypothetical protein
MKKVQQRNLPLDVKYTLVSVSHQSLEDGGYTCQNCGRLIANIASIKSEDGVISYVGLDCLDTLLEASLQLDTEGRLEYLYSALPAIAAAKAIRAKILKKLKEYPNYTLQGPYIVEKEQTFGFSFYLGKKDSRDDNQGWNYSLNLKYKDLIMSYLKGFKIVDKY